MKKTKYNGHTFDISGTCRYLFSYSKLLPERLLHRYVWHINIGPIPAGYHIHHIDEDIFNNDLSNLECIKAARHQAHHMNDRFLDPEYRQKNKEQLDVARVKASAWHGSPEGLDFHSVLGKKSWEDREPEVKNCSECGTEFTTHFPTRKHHCSNACWQREKYNKEKLLTVPCVCVVCTRDFTRPKSSRRVTCSPECQTRKRFSK